MFTDVSKRAVAIGHPSSSMVRVILIPQSGGDAPLSFDEEIMLHLDSEVRRLQARVNELTGVTSDKETLPKRVEP